MPASNIQRLAAKRISPNPNDRVTLREFGLVTCISIMLIHRRAVVIIYRNKCRNRPPAIDLVCNGKLS